MSFFVNSSADLLSSAVGAAVATTSRSTGTVFVQETAGTAGGRAKPAMGFPSKAGSAGSPSIRHKVGVMSKTVALPRAAEGMIAGSRRHEDARLLVPEKGACRTRFRSKRWAARFPAGSRGRRRGSASHLSFQRASPAHRGCGRPRRRGPRRRPCTSGSPLRRPPASSAPHSARGGARSRRCPGNRPSGARVPPGRRARARPSRSRA